MDNQPLVSVIVLCYNAADYIVETLESIKAQTYKNIELIVSDDCSKDGTTNIVNKWLGKNKNSFLRTELISIGHNTGVSANYNRAVRSCRGEWVKNVDGDDLLTSNCIEDNIKFVNDHPEVEWVFSNCSIFNGKDKKQTMRLFFTKNTPSFFTLTAQKQFHSLLKMNTLPSQTCFIKLGLLKRFPYNEKYKGLEDLPMWISLTKNNIKAYYFDKCTAYYRRGESMTSSSTRFFSPIYVESRNKFFWGEKYDYYKETGLVDAYNFQRKINLEMDFAEGFLNNKKNRFNYLIYKLAVWVINRYARFEF